MDKAKAMRLMAESHRETVEELEKTIKYWKKKYKKLNKHFKNHRRKTSENWRAQRATQNRNRQLENGIEFRDKEIDRYREVLDRILNHDVYKIDITAAGKMADKALEGDPHDI